MRDYKIKSPDGRVVTIRGPADATPEQLSAAAMAAFSMKPVARDTMLDQDLSPTAGMSGTDKFLAGTGKAFADLGRGVGQLLGAVSEEDVAASREEDAALMNTGAGMAGNVFGNLATVIPTVAIPGAATVRGAGLIGAAQGSLQPSANTGEALQNTALGGGLGAGGVAAGRALSGLYQGGKALIEPFTGSGRQRIAGRVIERFADDPASVMTASGGRSATGAIPTIAEETGDAGMARLQDAIRSADPQIAGRIDSRLSDNNAARIATLERLAGAGGRRDAAVTARESTAQPLYDAAISIDIDPNTLSPAQRGEITKLLRMPAIKDAMKVAKKNAANFGMAQGSNGSVAGMHQAKMAMDDTLRDLTNQGLGSSNKAKGILAAKNRLVTFMDSMTGGAYGDARATFADMSRPINQMDIAQEFLNKGTSATADLSGNQRLMPNALANMLKTPEAEAALIRKATKGKAGSNRLADIFDPQQESLLRAVASEVDRTGAVARAGAGPGSATAQRMAAQNILSQIAGPLGLPASFTESALAGTVVGKPLNLLYGGVAEPRIQQALADAVLDPAKAREALIAIGSGRVRAPDSLVKALTATAARNTPAALQFSKPEGR